MAGGSAGLDTPRTIEDAIAWQAQHCRENDAPVTARIIEAMRPLLGTDTRCGRRMADWRGLTAEAATPLRLAAGFHHLRLTGGDDRLLPVYSGALTRQDEVDEIVEAVTRDHDADLVRWFDSPPQTNEAGRSAAIVAALLWLSRRVGSRFEMNEIGASAGANTMIERYRYDLGGTQLGPEESPVVIRPDWQGPPPPDRPVEIVSIAGCDRSPIDLSDDAAAMRLRSYCWPENADRLERLDGVIGLARQQLPAVVMAEAADWVDQRLSRAHTPGVTRVLYHSIVWQYLPPASRARIEAAMAAAGARATDEAPLAWISLETNRVTFRHELLARFWPGGEEWTDLGEAHAHGAWVRWNGA